MLWNFISCLVGLLLNNTPSETIRLFFLLDGIICWNAPIWFLLQLFMVVISFFFIEKIYTFGKYFIIPALFALWYFISGNNVLLKLNILPVCLLFYIFGNIFKQIYDRYSSTRSKTPGYIIPSALLLLSINVVFGIFLNKRVSFTGADFGNVFYCCLAALSGILFYSLIFENTRYLRTSKVLSYLGRNSLIIMATQYWFFTFYDMLSNHLLGVSIWHYRNTAKALVLSVITILLICTATEIAKRISNKNHTFRKICIWSGINMN